MPKFSFIVPFFNKDKTIEKCLKSLLAQSVKDIEVIVVKDGPASDYANRILRKFEKKVLVMEIPHGGACKARNAGAEKATGKFIVFWDADSYIEPGAAMVWDQALTKWPDDDFVYAGYQFTNGQGGVESEPFDPWLLKVSNYISGHYPIRREKAPKWDESLESLQDWDFWLQAVNAGCKGRFLQGYSFKTEAPDKDSISGRGCSDENWLPRRNAVKDKHGLPRRDVCVTTAEDKEQALRLAKVLDADFMHLQMILRPHEYKTVVHVGLDVNQLDLYAYLFKQGGPKHVMFWLGGDVQTLYRCSLEAVEAVRGICNKFLAYQFCEDKRTRDLLTRAGFKAVPFPLPMKPAEVVAPMPEKFRVLVDVEREYSEFFNGIARAVPMVEFVPFKGAVNTDDFSMLMQFLHDKSVTPSAKKMLLSGRHVVSNIQAPHTGYVSDTEDVEKMREKVVRKVFEAMDGPPKPEIREFYAAACSPERFKTTFAGVVR